MKNIAQRLLAGLIFVFSSFTAAHALSPIQGTAQKLGNACVTTILTSAEIKVYNLDSNGNRITSPLPTLASDSGGTSLSNPFNAGSTNGYWIAWVPNGRYEVVITKGSDTYSQFTQAPTSTGAASGFINVKDSPYFAVGDGSTDDTWAIKKAVNDLGLVRGGVLYFPNGTYVVGTNSQTGGEQQLPIVLPTGVTIQGTNGGYFSSSKIYLPSTGSGKTVLKMKECTREVTIREIEIQSASSSGTTGFQATGKYPNSSHRLSLSHMTIRGFSTGVDIQATSDNGYGWQLANSEMDFVFIVENQTGVHIDAQNAEFQISNSELSAGSGGTALLVDHSSILQIHNTYGAGASADNFIWLRGRHGYVEATSIECEGFKNTLVNDYSSTLVDQYLFPIKISNSILGSKILLREDCIYVSSGNVYDATTVETVNNGTTVVPKRPDGSAYPAHSSGSTTRPSCDPLPTGGHADNVLIYSTGDFFYPLIAGGTCTTNIPLDSGAYGDFLLAGNSKLVFRAGQNSSDFNLPVNIGVPGFNYNLKRNNTNGFMDIFGTQSPPYRGFNFNGPIQLHSATWSEISAWQTIGLGAIIFCSDCVAGTNGACTYSSSSPRGEVARYTGNGWKCN